MAEDVALTESLEYLGEILESFDQNPTEQGRALREFHDKDPDRFYSAALVALGSVSSTPACKKLLSILLESGVLVAQICDPEVFTDQQAIQVARVAAEVDPTLDRELASHLTATRAPEAPSVPDWEADRILLLVNEISRGNRLVAALAPLLSSPNARLRSKVALLIGKRMANAKWAERYLDTVDARVRANIIETLWGLDDRGALTIFERAKSDSSNRVRGNALVGLYEAGQASAIGEIVKMSQESEPLSRATGTWVMGRTGDPRFLEFLTEMLQEDHPLVRSNAFKAYSKLKNKLNDYRELGKLDTQLMRIDYLGDRSRRVWVTVQNPDGKRGKSLPPTAFALFEDGRLSTRYEVSRISRPEALVIGFALSREGAVQDAELARAEEALFWCIDKKGRSDQFAIARLVHIGSENMASGPSPEDAQSVETEVSSVPYLSNPQSLASEVKTTNVTLCRSAASTQAVRMLATAARKQRGVKNIVIVAGLDLPSAVEAVNVIKTCHIEKSSVHVVAALEEEKQDNWRKVAQETGGIFVAADSPESVGAGIERIYRALYDRYEIKYRSPHKEHRPKDLRIEVYSPDGLGECNLPLSPPAHDAEPPAH